MLRDGESDVMLAGGSEAAITELGYAGFCSMKAMLLAIMILQLLVGRLIKVDGFVMVRAPCACYRDP